MALTITSPPKLDNVVYYWECPSPEDLDKIRQDIKSVPAFFRGPIITSRSSTSLELVLEFQNAILHRTSGSTASNFFSVNDLAWAKGQFFQLTERGWQTLE